MRAQPILKNTSEIVKTRGLLSWSGGQGSGTKIVSGVKKRKKKKGWGQQELYLAGHTRPGETGGDQCLFHRPRVSYETEEGGGRRRRADKRETSSA